MDDFHLPQVKELGASYNYGRGQPHAEQVGKLAVQIACTFRDEGICPVSADDVRVLEAAGWLHDTGKFPAVLEKYRAEAASSGIEWEDDGHNLLSFLMVKHELNPLLKARNLPPVPEEDEAALLYCILWHNGSKYPVLPETPGDWLPRCRRLAAIFRVADALDRGLVQKVASISVEPFTNEITGNSELGFTIGYHRAAGGRPSSLGKAFGLSTQPSRISLEIERALEKSDLMLKAFGLAAIHFKRTYIAD